MSTGAVEAQHAASIEIQRTLRLTDRWYPLNYHEGQARYFWAPQRFPVCPSGRRSGKTENAKRKVARELTRRRKQPARLGYCAPTQDQARQIYWEDLKALIPKHWVASTRESDPPHIVTKWGARVYVMGLDKPQRVEGQPWDRLFIDEIADTKPGCFARNIRPLFSTLGREGGCDLLGVPDEIGSNQGEYEMLWDIGCRWHPRLREFTDEQLAAAQADPDVCSYWWPSWEVIDPKEVAAARRAMDDLAFRQEFGGLFVTSGGKAVPRFDTQLHVNEKYCTYDKRLPLDWTLDFGTAPAASLICQTYRGQVWVMDEIVINDSSTDVAADEFVARCRRRDYDPRRLRIFGDAAGHGPHSNTGESDYEILEARAKRYGLRPDWLQLTAPPPIKDTLNAVRARACSADNVVRLFIHPRCTTLIKDLKTATWPDESNKLREHHCLAALRYYLFQLFGASDGYGVAGLALPNLGTNRPK